MDDKISSPPWDSLGAVQRPLDTVQRSNLPPRTVEFIPLDTMK